MMSENDGMFKVIEPSDIIRYLNDKAYNAVDYIVERLLINNNDSLIESNDEIEITHKYRQCFIPTTVRLVSFDNEDKLNSIIHISVNEDDDYEYHSSGNPILINGEETTKRITFTTLVKNLVMTGYDFRNYEEELPF